MQNFEIVILFVGPMVREVNKKSHADFWQSSNFTAKFSTELAMVWYCRRTGRLSRRVSSEVLSIFSAALDLIS